MAVDFDFHGTCTNCGAKNELVWGSDTHISFDNMTPHPLWHCKFCLGGHNPKKINYHKRERRKERRMRKRAAHRLTD